MTINAFNFTPGGAGGDTQPYMNAALRGLTLGGWFYFDGAAAADEYLMARWNPGVLQAYRLLRLAAGTIQGSIDAGGGAVSVTTTATVGALAWTWIVLRFDPSTTMDIFVNRDITTLAVGVPATIQNTALDFTIGADHLGGNCFDGRIGRGFVCAAVLPDVTINHIFDTTRAAYNA